MYNLSKIFVNRRTGDLIIVYYKYIYPYTERNVFLYKQKKDITMPIDTDTKRSLVFYTNYIKAQLNKNWVQASKLITYDNEDTRERIFSFRHRYYKQILYKHSKQIVCSNITKEDYNYIFKSFKEPNNKKSTLRNVETVKYIRDSDLFSVLESL